MKRKLGRSNVECSALGMGCWAIGGPVWSGQQPLGWGEVDDGESMKAIHRALDMGISFFDTADVYGCGHSERVLARALGGERSKVLIASKFGNCFDENTRQVGWQDASPAYIRAACEASLRRLETDYIDLYQFHINAYELEKAAEVREILESLVQEGKIRFYAWSTDDPERARFFAAGDHCTAVQHKMNVLEDAALMIAACERENLASINRGPLGMGLLTGKYNKASKLADDDVRGVHSPEWMRYFHNGMPNSNLLEKLEAIREILTSSGRTLAQGAIAWLWGRSRQTIPIPGIRTPHQAEENAGALSAGPLTAENMTEIEEILQRDPA